MYVGSYILTMALILKEFFNLFQVTAVECLLIDNLDFSILSSEAHTLNLRTLASHRTLSFTLTYGGRAVQTVLHDSNLS